MKVLITDDQVSIHKFLDNMIDWETLGVTQVFHAYNGDEAVKMVRSIQPDIIILDIQMPVLDGIGVLKALDVNGKPKTVVLSAYNEFEYAREAMRFGVKNYLLKPIDTIVVHSTIQTLIQEIKEETKTLAKVSLNKVVQASTIDEVTLQTIQQCFQILEVNEFVSVCITVWETDIEQVVSVLNLDVLKPLNTYILRESSLYIYIVECISSERPVMTIYDFYKECLDRIRKNSGQYHCSIGVSYTQTDVENLLVCLNQSEVAAKMGFYHPYEVHKYSESMFTDGLDKLMIKIFEEDFIEKLQLGYSEKILGKQINLFFSQLREQQVSPNRVYQVCYDFIFWIVKKMDFTTTEIADFESLKLDDLKKYRTIDDLQSYVFHIVTAAIQTKPTDASTTAADIVAKIKQHVETHYREDVSLQVISEKFFIDKYQLSRLFKKRFGVNYWPYVTKIRMEKAAELLRNTDQKMIQIAVKIGYSDESHFSSTFKKHFGVSPKEYKTNFLRGL
jgi:two-component system, response regulator YesN